MAETFLFLPFTLVNYDLVYNPLDIFQTLTRIDVQLQAKTFLQSIKYYSSPAIGHSASRNNKIPQLKLIFSQVIWCTLSPMIPQFSN